MIGLGNRGRLRVVVVSRFVQTSDDRVGLEVDSTAVNAPVILPASSAESDG